MIEYSAIKINFENGNETIIVGKRHSDCFLQISELFNPLEYRNHTTQGFVKRGELGEYIFMNREEASKYAYECGQIKEPLIKLYSEDLW